MNPLSHQVRDAPSLVSSNDILARSNKDDDYLQNTDFNNGNELGSANTKNKVALISPKRLYFIFIILGGVVVVLLVALLTSFLVLQHKDNREVSSNLKQESEAGRYWASMCRDSVVEAVSAAYSLSGFVMGKMKTIPPLNGTVEERTEGQYFDDFLSYGKLLYSTMQYAETVATAPGGVFLQTYPPNSSSVGSDILRNPYDDNRTAPLETIINGQSALIGPLKSSLGVGTDWLVDVRLPVYDAQLSSDLSNLERFWGFVYAIISVDKLLIANDIRSFMREREMDYVMYSNALGSSDTDVDGLLRIVSTSLGFNTSDEDVRAACRAFIVSPDTSRRAILDTQMSWYIAVGKKNEKGYLTRTNIVIILVCTICSVVLIAAALFIVMWCCTKEYEPYKCAPSSTPFVVLSFGPYNGEDLWNLAPDQMVEVSEKLLNLSEKHMIAHKGCLIPQLHPYTTSYVLHSVDAAVEMALDVLEEAKKKSVDAPMRLLLGSDDGRLMLSCAVHYCTDATVTSDNVAQLFRYEGPDILFSARMWIFAAPNTVTLSKAAKLQLNTISHPRMTVQFLNSVFLRGVKERQDMYIITDKDSKLLREAANAAAKRLRKAHEKTKTGLFLARLSDSSSNVSSSSLTTDSFNFSNGGMLSSVGATPSVPLFVVPPEQPMTSEVDSLSSSTSAGSPLRMSDGRVLLGRKKPIPKPDVYRYDPTNTDDVIPDIMKQPELQTTPVRGQDFHPLHPGSVTSLSDSGSSSGRRPPQVRKSKQPTKIDVPSGPLLTAPPPLEGVSRPSSSLPFNPSASASAGDVRSSSVPSGEDSRDTPINSLLRPSIPKWLDKALRSAFEHQAIALDISYDSVRLMVFYFFASYKLLFRPLSAAERANIHRRLSVAFGVPQQNILDHLAARCTIRYLQQYEEARSLLWNRQLQLQVQRPYTSNTTDDEGKRPLEK
ncbi:hypothetical protein AGDE_13827 [Angomonas deanei]|nr:hypothetical protein AGDE_13827 [Angomonas deanei]|eukprot:EPY21722.1 hypothetical protein AGDE_13827 [Angomonas deanei]